MRIYVIGSLSCSDRIESIANHYKKFGHEVSYVKKEPNILFEKLVEDCYTRINMADKIVAVTKKDGSIGEGTTYEVTFARFLGKNIEMC